MPAITLGEAMTLVTVPEAAVRLGISPQTVKRRLKRGELGGEQRATPQGFNWLIEVPEEHTTNGTPNGIPTGTPMSSAIGADDISAGIPSGDSSVYELVAALQTQVDAQQKQLEAKDRQIGELHVLLQRAQLALPAPEQSRPWWRRLWPRAAPTG